ncbi:MAG: coxL1 [Rhodospirillaceae bacterium]|nr:MAG: coxL1 [Rhodospirillaceae bacterium]
MTTRIGMPLPRVEDERFLTGTGRYTDDITLPRQLRGAVVRSPHAHARIKHLDPSAALAILGVLAVYTITDLDAGGIGPLPCDVILTNRNGHPMTVPERPVLAREKVRYVGEPVAFVVAETEMAARDGAEAVAVEYDDRPAVTDARAALCSDAPRLYESVPGNLLFD